MHIPCLAPKAPMLSRLRIGFHCMKGRITALPDNGNRITNIKTHRSQCAALEGLSWPKNTKTKKSGHLNIPKNKKKNFINNFIKNPTISTAVEGQWWGSDEWGDPGRARTVDIEWGNSHFLQNFGDCRAPPGSGGSLALSQSIISMKEFHSSLCF